MKGRPTPWSADELAWIEARRHMPRAALHAAFVAAFARGDVTLVHISALCKRRGWMTGRTGRYAPGAVPANKGKAMPYNARSAATRFAIGVRQGRAAMLHKPIGTERVTRDGYLERKVHDGLPRQSRWRAVHLIRWEEAHGPVPPGHALKCLNGDRTNTDPSNWACVPRGLLPRLNSRFGRGYDAAEPEVRPVIMAIAELAHAAGAARKRRNGAR